MFKIEFLSKNRIQQYFTWDKLKKINSLKVINSMYIWIFIVPVILKVFESLNQTIFDFEVFNQIITLHLELPFSLIIFYFSAIFFAIGNMLIQTQCPIIIAENNSYTDFQDKGKGNPHIAEYEENALGNHQNSDNMLSDLYTAQDKKDAIITFQEIHKKYFWIIYDEAKKVKFYRRLLTSLFYLLGFVLMSIILIQNLYYIIKVV